MQIRVLTWLLSFAFVFSGTPLFAQAPGANAAPATTLQPGTVLIARVEGTVLMSVDGVTTPVKRDDKIPQKAKITTMADSIVMLVFSNGATTQLGADSELVIEEFLQDPFADVVKAGEMNEEPTTSRTRLSLNKGELTGKVKPLRRDKGSSFTIQTPVGAAGIRGTTFRIVFRPTGSGQAFGGGGGQNFRFELSTLEGNVGFQPVGQGGQPGTPTLPTQGQVTLDGVSVPTGQEIVVTVSVTQNQQGQLVVTAPPTVTSTVALDTSKAAAISIVAQDIATAIEQVILTSPPANNSTNNSNSSNSTPSESTDTSKQSSDSNASNNANNNSNSSNNNSSGNQSSNNQSNSNQNNPPVNPSPVVPPVTNPPPPTVPAPRTTTGDGRPGANP